MESIIRMTPGEWSAVPGNPRQRNTEERVRRAKHLFNPTKDHRVVKMALLPDGRRFKIDGHTRDLFWKLHPEIAPDELVVVVYHADDLDEVLALYDNCDNAAALETSTDKVFGAFRQLGYSPTSTFMQVGRVAAALRLASGIEQGKPDARNAQGMDVHSMVEHWFPELKWLDELGLSPTYFNSPVLTAALVTLRRYRVVGGEGEFSYQVGLGTKTPSPLGGRPFERGQRAKEFWQRFARHEGDKTGRQVDPIEALRILVDRNRDTHTHKATVYFLAARAVACVERYLLKRTYKIQDNGSVLVKAIDLATYFPRTAKPAVEPAAAREETAVVAEAAA